jgi:hypothetical protein
VLAATSVECSGMEDTRRRMEDADEGEAIG